MISTLFAFLMADFVFISIDNVFKLPSSLDSTIQCNVVVNKNYKTKFEEILPINNSSSPVGVVLTLFISMVFSAC